MSTKNIEIKKLDAAIAHMWENIFSTITSKVFTNGFIDKDKRIYALYLTQVYHYAYHTPRNLALAGANLKNTNTYFMHYCFEHAMEETGHELMALHDLKMLGVSTDTPKVLASTEAIIGYVKYLATSETPYRILGYSYWIERPYKYILQFMEQMERAMGLKKNQLTFYYNHIEIDKKHGKDIENALINVCQTTEHWQAVRESAIKSMQLSLSMYLEIIEEYNELDNKETSFGMINKIK